ncbi:MAG TPA: VWA domain-containing protein [Candidatus Binataceae bacterium]|nr:VWA domain-containing protein [Candidatus Binataceae bacterium]
MARSRKPIKSRRVYVPVMPAATLWIENDGYDRRAWSEIVAEAPAIGELVEAGSRLVPHFGALLQDLFLALFKYNLVWQAPDAVRKSAMLNRTILEAVIPSPSFEALKNRTLLEEDKAAIAALVLGEQVLETIRSEKMLNRREILDLWDLKHQEDDLEQKIEALKSAIELEQDNKQQLPKEEVESGEVDPERREIDPKKRAAALKQLKDAAERGAQVAEARLKQKARAVQDQIAHGDRTELRRMELKSAEMAGEIDRIAEDSHDFSREFGQGGRLAAGERLELGRRLARNRRLGELARLVGRLKHEARAVKHRLLERGVAEAYDIERGADLGRLVPSELIALHHPGLARDFGRRLIEGELLQYRLRDDQQKGRGPMVVCIDVSSSMQGDKELWAKAVSLTLMDIARRQRRLFRAVLFSSGDESLKVLDLNRERRYQPELRKVLEMAEYFAGGGTDFERPLSRALELIEDKKLKHGDIVIITDGESQVSPEFLRHLRARKEELGFSIFAVLVDLGSSELSTLAQFSDRVTSVKKLTTDTARDIFLKIQA